MSPAEYTQDEEERSTILASAGQRAFILKLAQARGRSRSADAVTDATKDIETSLLSAGLVRREYLVICRQDGHTICTVPDSSELEQSGGASFKCSVCGRGLSNEVLQEILAITDDARKLLDGSRWMQIHVTAILERAGVKRDNIHWGLTSNEDELDISADILGLKAFFELKDREFGLGDAYPFAFRVSRYGGDVGVVVTTDTVAEEARKFFSESPGTATSVPIETLQGLDDAKKSIPRLVDQWSRRAVRQAVAESLSVAPIDLGAVMDVWMEHKGRTAPA